MAETPVRREFDAILDNKRVEGRLPPNALEIEEQVLGAMLLEKEAISRVLEVLDSDVFYSEQNRKIFQAIIALFERSEPADVITVAEELRRRGNLDAAGGESALVELTLKVTSGAHVEYHARIVLEKALMRRLISESTAIARLTRWIEPTRRSSSYPSRD
jgi:replicative DNA helicase